MSNQKGIGGIILAAGKGKRMQSKTTNKVVLSLGGKPMIGYGLSLMKKLGVSPIIVVVGFAKESVINALRGEPVLYAYQRKQLGVAHAIFCGLKILPGTIEHVLVFNGDDSAFYTKETIRKLFNVHFNSGADLTFLTTEVENPSGLGRVQRDKKRNAIQIIEEKDATAKEKKIQEVNLGCYVFRVNFLRRYVTKIKKSKATGEYYPTKLVELAVYNNLTVETVHINRLPWRGVNTKGELKQAEKLFVQV